VFKALQSAKLPVTRIGHSRMSVRHALMRAQLLFELSRAEASQAAVLLLRRIGVPRKGARHKLPENEVLRVCALRFAGKLLLPNRAEACNLTSRGRVEQALKRMTVTTGGEGLEH